QSDIINAKVERPRCIETTALGAAYLGGLALGYWEDLQEISENWQIDKSYQPNISTETRENLIYGWTKAVKKALNNN
ncbi:MAG: glycerol kinase, partial [Clostridiales bacterium]